MKPGKTFTAFKTAVPASALLCGGRKKRKRRSLLTFSRASSVCCVVLGQTRCGDSYQDNRDKLPTKTDSRTQTLVTLPSFTRVREADPLSWTGILLLLLVKGKRAEYPFVASHFFLVSYVFLTGSTHTHVQSVSADSCSLTVG